MPASSHAIVRNWLRWKVKVISFIADGHSDARPSFPFELLNENGMEKRMADARNGNGMRLDTHFNINTFSRNENQIIGSEKRRGREF